MLGTWPGQHLSADAANIGAVDQRLIPINGLLALLRGEGGWPGILRDQGFRRHQLEVPISSPLGDARADVLIYRRQPDLILLCECKSGRNIEERQARRYVAVDVSWLRRSGAIPPELMRARHAVHVHPLFVGREEHRADLERGLRHLDIDAPLVTIGAQRVRLSGASEIDGLDDFDQQHAGGLPPARIPVDHQSADEELRELLIPELIAAQARAEEIVAIETIAARMLPEWTILSKGARGLFIDRLERLLTSIVKGEFGGQFHYERAPGTGDRGRIVIKATPATRDPRGRTQAWQAQQRRAELALRRRSRKQIPGQLSIDDLADQGGLAEE